MVYSRLSLFDHTHNMYMLHRYFDYLFGESCRTHNMPVMPHYTVGHTMHIESIMSECKNNNIIIIVYTEGKVNVYVYIIRLCKCLHSVSHKHNIETK